MTIKYLWEKIKKEPYTLSYFPDYPNGVLPDSKYFYTIINTIHDNFINAQIKDAYKNRNVYNKKD